MVCSFGSCCIARVSDDRLWCCREPCPPRSEEALLAQVVAGGWLVRPMEHVPVSERWPTVRSDACVMYTAAQFPVADVNDEEGLLKLVVSCSRCLNPYHIALDCPNYPEDEVDEENPQAC